MNDNTPTRDAIVSAAKASGATVLETSGAVVIVLPIKTDDPNELLPLVEAANIAATTTRVVKDAIRAGELPAVGRQRDRAIRRADLEAWIETRRTPLGRVEEGQEARVEARLARARRAAS